MLNSNNTNIATMIQISHTPPSLPSKDKSLGLITGDEVRTILGYYEYEGIKRFNLYISALLSRLESNGVLTRDRILDKEAVLECFVDLAKSTISFYYQVYKIYILCNMLFNRLDIQRSFIEKEVYKNTKPLIKVFLFNWYKRNKPNYLPDIENIEWKLKFFYCSLALFYSEDNITDGIIIEELTSHLYPHNDNIFTNTLGNRIEILRTFLSLSGQMFREKGYLKPRKEMLRFLYYKIGGKDITESKDEGIRRYCFEIMKQYEDTEFYDVIVAFIDEKISKRQLLNTLKSYATVWARLSELAIENGCMNLKEVDAIVRDEYIFRYIDEQSVVTNFKYILQVYKYYNKRFATGGFESYVDPFLFSATHIPKKPSDVKHTGYMKEAQNVLVAAIGSEMEMTRKSYEELISSNNIQTFFLSRLCWIKALTGCRVTELREMDLDEVKTTIKHKNPYLYIRTEKDNENRKFTLFRGNRLEKDKYELDCVHIDILQELIVMAKKLYNDILLSEEDSKLLFPSPLGSIFSPTTINNYLARIQDKHSLVCGSPYDIIPKEVYEGNPALKDRVEKRKPLFTLHSIRHMHIEKLLLYGMTNRFHMAKVIGHRNIYSQEDYKNAADGIIEVAKLMQEHEHFGAKNKLMSHEGIIVDKEIDQKELQIAKNVEKHVNILEKAEGISYNEAAGYIDVNTDCNTKIACSDTGIGCLGCDDFKSGKETHEAILNVSAVLVTEFKVIDFEISRLNDKKFRKKSELILFEKLLRTILDRFENIENAKNRTFLDQENFNWDVEKTDKFFLRIAKRTRKNNLDKEVIVYIKKIVKEKKLHETIISRLYLITNKLNKKVFV